MKLVKILILALLTATLLAGCNTFRGIGQDVSNLGGAISRAAD